MTIRLEPKRSDEVRDYRHDWEPFLGEDTIASQDAVATGATLDSVEIETGDKSVIFWISGGTDGTTAQITHSITTAGGRTEAETFLLPIGDSEPISLVDAKAYLRVLHDDEDAKIRAMIPRARLWVEDHTGLSLIQREFVERHLPKYGAIRLFKGPLVSVDGVAYVDADGAQTYVPRAFPPSLVIWPAADESWPALSDGNQFEVTYTAGCAEGECDDRLIGAMLALIEGEYSEGYAYPERATDAAERCCAYLRTMVA